MTDWDAIAEQGRQHDTLEKIVADIEGALLPMMKAMPAVPDWDQCTLLMDEIEEIYCGVYDLRKKVRRGD